MMNKAEIVKAISEDKTMPFIEPYQLSEIVDFVIKNYQPSLPSNLDEAAQEYAKLRKSAYETVFYAFKTGVEWMAGQGVTKEAVIGMATEEIYINVSMQTLDELDLCPGDKVVVQIRKK